MHSPPTFTLCGRIILFFVSVLVTPRPRRRRLEDVLCSVFMFRCAPHPLTPKRLPVTVPATVDERQVTGIILGVRCPFRPRAVVARAVVAPLSIVPVYAPGLPANKTGRRYSGNRHQLLRTLPHTVDPTCVKGFFQRQPALLWGRPPICVLCILVFGFWCVGRSVGGPSRRLVIVA